MSEHSQKSLTEAGTSSLVAHLRLYRATFNSKGREADAYDAGEAMILAYSAQQAETLLREQVKESPGGWGEEIVVIATEVPFAPHVVDWSAPE